MMKRCFYIANSYDGAYFVLTDDLQEYANRMGSYVINLENSQKINHYSFGSVEMSAIEYDRYHAEAKRLEGSLIDQKKQEKEIAASEVVPMSEQLQDAQKEDASSQNSNKEKTSKGHLRLV
jgi:hypothetical protein